MAVQTQWRYAGMAGLPTGLDYAGVCAYLQAQGFRPRAKPPWSLGTLLEDLRAMESIAIEEWAARAHRKAAQ